MKRVLALCFCVLTCCNMLAVTITGKVIGIMDGDTIEVLTQDKKPIKIRLAHIDCPEKKQAFGNAAKKYTSSLCYMKEVKVNISGYDRNKRAIGEVYVGELYVNLSIVQSGYAWHYKKYSKNNQFAEAEITARTNKKGIWSDANVIAPWEFRKRK